MTSFESTTTRLPHHVADLCPLIEDLLPLYIEGEVTTATSDLMANHLAHCDHCAGFLAGAQSARTQLRRDAAARASVVAHDHPAQQTVISIQSVIKSVILLGVSLGVIMFSGGVWSSLMRDSAMQGAGPLLALIAFALAGQRFQRRRHLTLSEWTVLAAASVAVGIGISGVLGWPYGHDPIPFFGMLLVIAGAAGMRYVWGQGGSQAAR